MDFPLNYAEIVKKALTNYVNYLLSGGVTSLRTLFHDEQNSYLVLDIGWQADKYIHTTSIHIDLIDGKIWIQNDRTEDGIATNLLALGVPKTDIVLGFKHPSLRPFTEFAVG